MWLTLNLVSIWYTGISEIFQFPSKIYPKFQLNGSAANLYSKITSGPTSSKWISINKNNIKRLIDGKVVDKPDMVDKPNSETWEYKTGFLTPRARLTFTQLRQAFSTVRIIYYFIPECHRWIKTNA